MNQPPPLDALVELALEAGREIMRVRGDGFAAMKKGDGSPVTIADQRAEAIIEAGLAKLCPGAPMIGEESVAAGVVPACGPFFFCVDPLDGTRDFVAGGDEFTVNIGLIERGAPTMGVVYAPASGELFAGEPGRAVKGEAQTPIVAAAEKPAQGWRVVASRHSGRNAATAAFLAAIGPHTLCNGSSSIKFCRLAENAADLYPRFGEVNEWDAAAGHAVLNAAGGGVMRLDGSPLVYGAPDGDFLVRGFIAYANAAAQAAARDAIKR